MLRHLLIEVSGAGEKNCESCQFLIRPHDKGHFGCDLFHEWRLEPKRLPECLESEKEAGR